MPDGCRNLSCFQAHQVKFGAVPLFLPLAGLVSKRARRAAQDESIMRKKYFNQMEDMKGKIRVYARVRPMLGFEAERGQKARGAPSCPFSYNQLQWECP